MKAAPTKKRETHQDWIELVQYSLKRYRRFDPLRAWKRARYSGMYPSTASRICRIGEKLVELGFVQAHKKPYIFKLHLAEGFGIVFADLGGTDVIPVWEEDGPMLYWKLNCTDDATKREIVEAVIAVCADAGIQPRLSHYVESEPDGLFFCGYRHVAEVMSGSVYYDGDEEDML